MKVAITWRTVEHPCRFADLILGALLRLFGMPRYNVKKELRSVESTTVDNAFKEILRIANDKRSHVLMEDAIEWLELKMKAIAKIAKQGRKLSK